MLPGCAPEPDLMSPTGHEIQGTSEMIPGAATVAFFEPDAENPHGYEHDGNGTKMFWDGSVTQEIDGVPMFVDNDGTDWLRHHLIPTSAEPLTDETIAAMKWEIMVGETHREAEALTRSLEALHTRFGFLTSCVEQPNKDLRDALTAAREKSIALRQRDLDAQETAS